MNQPSVHVLYWWICLSIIACINILLLFISFQILTNKMKKMPCDLFAIRKWQFIFSSFYVLGCAFRSFVPRGDIERIVLIDSWVSSILLGRSVATIAELCFVAQWSLILHEIGKYTLNKKTFKISKIILPIILLAEIFSWFACITKNYMGTVIEESLWAIACSLFIWGLFISRIYYVKFQKNFISIGIIMGLLYVIYIMTIDVLVYFSHLF